MRNAIVVWALGLLALGAVPACSTVETTPMSPDATRIVLNQSTQFSGPDGTEVLVPAGSYRVEPAGASQLKLAPTDGTASHLLAAREGTSDVEVPAPAAAAVFTEPDGYDVMLLQPNRRVYEAHGAPATVQPRGVQSLPPRTTTSSS